MERTLLYIGLGAAAGAFLHKPRLTGALIGAGAGLVVERLLLPKTALAAVVPEGEPVMSTVSKDTLQKLALATGAEVGGVSQQPAQVLEPDEVVLGAFDDEVSEYNPYWDAYGGDFTEIDRRWTE